MLFFTPQVTHMYNTHGYQIPLVRLYLVSSTRYQHACAAVQAENIVPDRALSIDLTRIIYLHPLFNGGPQ